jgi:hypothetical protein
MREIRTYGSEGGETGQPVFPTPIGFALTRSHGDTESPCQHGHPGVGQLGSGV